jgi:hypothetical protein
MVLLEVQARSLDLTSYIQARLGVVLGMVFTCCVPKQKVRWVDARNWDEIEA